jgi:hypothetical protein
MTIIPQSAPSGLTPANSLLLPSKAPGVKERAAKIAAARSATNAAAEQQQHAGAKRRREEEEAAAEDEEEEKQHSLGAAARFAAAREQHHKPHADTTAIEPGSINLSEGVSDGVNPEEINLDEDEEEDEPNIAVKQIPDAVFGLGGGK